LFCTLLTLEVFCVSRILTSILRIASVSLPQNIHLALAAQIFLAAGILILFIINIVFAMRLVRSTHRSFGWHPAFGTAFKLLFVVIGATLVMLIAGTIQSFYTLDPQILASDRSLQLYGSTVLAIVATLPLPMAALTLLIPYSPLDEFGAGRLRTKVIVLLMSTTLLSVGAWYRCVIVWQPPVPRSQPLPGYLAKGPFYIINFLIEFQTVIMYAILRVDQRYHIPNGAKGPGSYSRAQPHGDVEMQDSRPTSAASSTAKSSTSIHEKKDRATVEIVTRIEIKDTSHLLAVPPPSRATSSRRTSSQRLQNLLTRKPTSSLKKQWRASKESPIVRRLGGPWSQLPSPAESTFSLDAPSFNLDTPTTFSFDAHSTIGQATRIDVRTGRSVSCAAPSIRDTLRGGDGVD
jgi:hypothetical protein